MLYTTTHRCYSHIDKIWHSNTCKPPSESMYVKTYDITGKSVSELLFEGVNTNDVRCTLIKLSPLTIPRFKSSPAAPRGVAHQNWYHNKSVYDLLFECILLPLYSKKLIKYISQQFDVVGYLRLEKTSKSSCRYKVALLYHFESYHAETLHRKSLPIILAAC